MKNLRKKQKLKFCLVVDTEADFYYKIPSPEMRGSWFLRWKLNNILGKAYKYPKNRKGLVNLVNLLKRYEFPACFAIVGHLYLKRCGGWPHFSEKKPKAEWFRRMMKKEWYDFDPCSDYTKKPGFYLGDFIEKEMKTGYFTFGLHGFSHEAYLTEDEGMIDSSIKAGIEAAALRGIKLKIYDGPWTMIEDVNEPGKLLEILEKNDFKFVFHEGLNKGLFHKHIQDILPIEKKGNLKIIRISKMVDGTSKEEEFGMVIREIKNNKYKNAVYCLSIHDFTWKKKGIKKLERVILKIKELEKRGAIEIMRF